VNGVHNLSVATTSHVNVKAAGTLTVYVLLLRNLITVVYYSLISAAG